VEVSEARRKSRPSAGRDRMEELDRAFFERVEQGFQAIAAAEPKRVRLIEATRAIETVHEQIWKWVMPLLSQS